MKEAPTGTVARAVQVLRVLAEEGDGVTVAGLAERLGLPRPTAHRLLGLLRDQGMVEAADGRYRIGQEFFRLAALVGRRNDLVRLARPFMEQVVEETEETCLLGVYLPAEHQMMFAAEAPSPHPLGYRIELFEPISIAWGATGRAILANLPPAEREAVLEREGPSPVTGKKLPSRSTLEREFEQIRERGYAFSAGQKIPDSRGIAAPVIDASGWAIGSICLTIPDMRFAPDSEERIGAVAAARAAELSRLLGATETPAAGGAASAP